MSSRQRERKVERISAIAASSPSCAVDIGRTTSITSDPENSLVARRQSAITAALERRRAKRVDRSTEDGTEMPLAQNVTSTSSSTEARGPTQETHSTRPRLSGESERIGEGNWDETSPFGERFGYL